jgi:hypothetical protein
MKKSDEYLLVKLLGTIEVVAHGRFSVLLCALITVFVFWCSMS